MILNAIFMILHSHHNFVKRSRIKFHAFPLSSRVFIYRTHDTAHDHSAHIGNLFELGFAAVAGVFILNKAPKTNIHKQNQETHDIINDRYCRLKEKG